MSNLGDLPRPVQLRRLRALAHDALAAYGVQPDAMRLLRYEDNAVYSVRRGAERYSLRLSIVEGRTHDEQHSELAWLEAMNRRGAIRVPEPVPALDGSLVVTLPAPFLDEPSTVVLFRWLDGRIDPPYSQTLAGDLGRVTARLHLESEAFVRPPGFTRPSWGVDDLFDRGAGLNDPRRHETLGSGGPEVVGAAGARVRRTLPPPGGEWGLVHADLHAENLVLCPDGTVAVIDFDDCGDGWFMLDVGTVLASMFRRSGSSRAYQRGASRYLEGYAEVRPLPPSIDHLEAFLVLRDMVILNFVTNSRNPTVAEWGPGRAQGIVASLAAWLDGEPYPGALSV